MSEFRPGFTGWRKKFIKFATIVLHVLGFCCAVMMLLPNVANWNNRLLAKLALIFVSIIPPAYAWWEFNFVWRTAPDKERPPLEEFKHIHELGRNTWLALVALLVALYFS